MFELLNPEQDSGNMGADKESLLENMVDWQVTATTIYCDAVADEVTIVVYKDWSVKCTGYEKYAGSRRAPAKPAKENASPKRLAGCEGLGCQCVTWYKEKLLTEEIRKNQQSTAADK